MFAWDFVHIRLDPSDAPFFPSALLLHSAVFSVVRNAWPGLAGLRKPGTAGERNVQ